MQGVPIELMPGVLALIQQDIHGVHYDVQNYILWNLDHVLSDVRVECGVCDGDDDASGDSSECSGSSKDDSSEGSEYNTDYDEDAPYDNDSLSYDDDSFDEPYEEFGLTLMFEILRGWAMPMLAGANNL